jgi:hypothetical protein
MIREPHERAILQEAKAIRARENRERKAARPVLERVAGQRQPRVRDNGYLAALRRLPCCIGWGCSGRVEAAHIRYSNPAVGRINPGMQQKSDDRWALPCCQGHHAAQHKVNERAFWSAWGIDPDDLSSRLYAAYRAGEDLNPIVEQARRQVAATAQDSRP